MECRMIRTVSLCLVILSIACRSGAAQTGARSQNRAQDSVWRAVLHEIAVSTMGPAFVRAHCRLAEAPEANSGVFLYEPDSLASRIDPAWLIDAVRTGLVGDWCFADTPAKCHGEGSFTFLSLSAPEMRGDTADVVVQRIDIVLPEGWHGSRALRYTVIRGGQWRARLVPGSPGPPSETCWTLLRAELPLGRWFR